MTPQQSAAVALSLVVGVAAAYDLGAAIFGRPEHLISPLLRDLAMRYPILPFSAGVVIGHLFWP